MRKMPVCYTCALQRVRGNTKPAQSKMRGKTGHIPLTVGSLGFKEFVSSASHISPRFSDSRAGKDRFQGRKKYLAGCSCETSYLPEAKHSMTICVCCPRESSTFLHMFLVSFILIVT